MFIAMDIGRAPVAAGLGLAGIGNTTTGDTTGEKATGDSTKML